MPRSTRRARRGIRSAALLTVLAVVAAALAACSSPGQPGPGDPTYAELGRQALHTLEHGYYDGDGEWNVCVPHICGTGNVDWGVDSLTYALYFHWSLTHDRGVTPIMSALSGTAVNYSPALNTSSDVPVWDTIADIREYQVTGDVEALAKAEAAFRIGEVCCQPGHSQVFVDGTQTYDQTGIWQNKSSSDRSLPDSVLFAWRWPTTGRHTVQIRPGVPNAKEGGPFFHMTGYEVVP